MARPGGNPEITKYSYKSNREHPLTCNVNIRIDEPTKMALKAGELPGWSAIAREAIEKALAEKRAKEETENIKSAQCVIRSEPNK